MATSAAPARTSCGACDDGGKRAEAYEEALALTGNDVEHAFLAERLDNVRTYLPA
jgi:predicted RNA polymerase sigma factor